MLVSEFYLKKRATIDAMKTVEKVINDIKSYLESWCASARHNGSQTYGPDNFGVLGAPMNEMKTMDDRASLHQREFVRLHPLSGEVPPPDADVAEIARA